ncbi:hypothetical protein N8927_04450 [Crocinitomicaceae bacterium]|nr:hypothetical protein [Crocinitomicaceae bacterium]
MLRKLKILLILLFLSILSCNKDEMIEPVINKSKYYLHLSHTRTNSNPLMDTEAENLDFSNYEVLLLGGDLAYLTSADNITMNRVDSIFNVGNANTLWSLGNHDYTDLTKVEQYTNRPPYYSAHKDGITFVVLDTQDSLSNIVGSQKEYLMGILDTVQESTHLILLHHKLIWMYDDILLEPQISSVSNGPLDSCFYCINPNNFNSEIYPELVEVQSRGIEILCIGGDIGFNANEFEHITPDGIYFLASGINNNSADNKALLFIHDIANQSLEWEFRLLSDL